ncbi:MAG: hypothetical protein ACXWQA_01635 [Pseudobdellovibrionaceae bacterium]
MEAPFLGWFFALSGSTNHCLGYLMSFLGGEQGFFGLYRPFLRLATWFLTWSGFKGSAAGY